MLRSFAIESIHGTQNASFAPMAGQPPQNVSYTFTFFTRPTSDLPPQIKDH